jgi:predicted TIM-barrel fold metal-dependent hydrolase
MRQRLDEFLLRTEKERCARIAMTPSGSMQPTPGPIVDAHTHVFCWGENPEEGYLSERTRRAWLTRLVIWLTGLRKEAGATISEKIRSRLLRQAMASRLDSLVVLAQDAVYRRDGTRDDSATHFYVSNDYVFGLARDCPKILPGCSINPLRADALHELERCHEAGSRLVKVHTAIQGVDPSRRELDPFYKLAGELGMVLMFHTGYEHSCTVVSQKFTDPRNLARPLDHGGVVIAAHCGTCAFWDPEDNYPRFVEMMHRYDNLYGDTAVLASLIRWRSLGKLSRESESLRSRLIHGSDYPFPPARLPYLHRTGLFPAERRNPFDLDYRIKSSFNLGSGYGGQLFDLLRRSSPATLAVGNHGR